MSVQSGVKRPLRVSSHRSDVEAVFDREAGNYRLIFPYVEEGVTLVKKLSGATWHRPPSGSGYWTVDARNHRQLDSLMPALARLADQADEIAEFDRLRAPQGLAALTSLKPFKSGVLIVADGDFVDVTIPEGGEHTKLWGFFKRLRGRRKSATKWKLPAFAVLKISEMHSFIDSWVIEAMAKRDVRPSAER